MYPEELGKDPEGKYQKKISETNMRRKAVEKRNNISRVTVMALLMALLLFVTGCTSAADKISGLWIFTRITVEEVAADLTAAEVKAQGHDLPGFTADGRNFTFTNNGNTYRGTMKKDGKRWVLNPDNSSATMYAETDGNTLTLTINNSDTKLIFKKTSAATRSDAASAGEADPATGNAASAE